MKYNLLREVIDAKISGELPKEHFFETDNDCMWLSVPDPKDKGEYLTIFKGDDPRSELESLLKSFGLNVNRC